MFIWLLVYFKYDNYYLHMTILVDKFFQSKIHEQFMNSPCIIKERKNIYMLGNL